MRARTPTATPGLSMVLACTLAAMVLAGCGGGDDSTDQAAAPAAVVPPVPLPGPFPVACSNVAQDFARGDAEAFWEGRPATDGSPRYVAQLLVDAANTLSVSVTAPDDRTLYGSFAAKPVDYVVLVCYPTHPGNVRADFPLPTGQVVPRMQLGSDAPLLADASVRYPVLAFSHGLAESPLSDDHFLVLTWLASQVGRRARALATASSSDAGSLCLI